MASRATIRRTAVAVGAALVLPLGVAQAAPPGGTPGAAGIGDPYYPTYGNGGYDVDHYGIRVAYDPPSDRLVGKTMIRAHATKALSRFNLDFVLPVSTVRVDGHKAWFSQGEHELVVRPHRAIKEGKKFRVWVTYAGVPSTIESEGISPWIRTPDGAAAVGEPEIAAWWYPANDHPRDKATYDVEVTVAKDLEALGNGVLVSNTVRHGKRTWHWREQKPMAPYLAFFVVGQFDITTSTTDDGLPVINAIASNGGSEGEYAAADIARTPEVIDFEESQFGPYPFDAMGGVAPAADFGFALENQTRPVYTRGFWSDGPNIYVVVHELAHQWYGDSVSVKNWRDIWLNEGFASFAEWLWSEDHGEGTAAELFQEYWNYYRDRSDFWTVTIGDPGAHNEFNGAVYDRGAMTLQALRSKIGDEDFFTVMRAWAAKYRYGNGSIRQFIAMAEHVSGEELSSFFDVWLYTGERPEPTAENGFPPDFTPKAAARQARPASWDTIRHTHSVLSSLERR